MLVKKSVNCFNVSFQDLIVSGVLVACMKIYGREIIKVFIDVILKEAAEILSINKCE